MKRVLLFLLCFTTAACNSLLPYKGQSLDDLHQVVQNPQKYQGHIVSFSGLIRGINEDIHLVKLVLKVETPLYYYATGKDPLSYQLLLVNFKKEQPQNTGLTAGKYIKILAKIDRFETRKNALGTPIAVLHMNAIALADRADKKDFFHSVSPDKELYLSWKAGRLFFKETPQQIVTAFTPAPTQPSPVKKKKEISPSKKAPNETPIIFEEEEEENFILPQD